MPDDEKLDHVAATTPMVAAMSMSGNIQRLNIAVLLLRVCAVDAANVCAHPVAANDLPFENPPSATRRASLCSAISYGSRSNAFEPTIRLLNWKRKHTDGLRELLSRVCDHGARASLEVLAEMSQVCEIATASQNVELIS